MADQWPVDSDIILEEVINGMRKARKPKVLILNILQGVLFLKKIFRSQHIYQENPATLTLRR